MIALFSLRSLRTDWLNAVVSATILLMLARPLEARSSDLTPVALPPEMQRSQDWQLGASCGANALFLMLRLYDKDKSVELSDLRRTLAPGERGNSLAELSRHAKAFGLPTEVVRANRDGFRSLRVPFLVHLRSGDRGHMCMIVDQGGGYIHMIDGTTLAPHRTSEADFFKLWSGYAMVVRESAAEHALRWALFLQSLALVFFVCRPVFSSRAVKVQAEGDTST